MIVSHFFVIVLIWALVIWAQMGQHWGKADALVEFWVAAGGRSLQISLSLITLYPQRRPQNPQPPESKQFHIYIVIVAPSRKLA